MKSTYLYSYICPLLFIIALFTSCNGQEKSTLSKGSQLANTTLLGYRSQSDLQISEYIRNVFQDKNGHLWFGTNGFGVAHFNGDSLYYFSNDQGFNGGQITGMTEDLDRNTVAQVEVPRYLPLCRFPKSWKTIMLLYTGTSADLNFLWAILIPVHLPLINLSETLI